MRLLYVALDEGSWHGEVAVHFLREIFHHHIGIPEHGRSLHYP